MDKSIEQSDLLFKTLQQRFEKNMNRHPDLNWSDIQKKLESNPEKLQSLKAMEETSGEPDVIGFENNQYIFCDCSPETPKGRRSICYDYEALESRKEHKPKNSAVEMASEMGIELLDEEQYCKLQQLGKFDTKSSSWLRTPKEVRELGGAIFGDWRFGRVFIYHNGAESYYSVRGFRGILRF
jgi:hypothetical protein